MHIYFVLNRSGSMQSIAPDVIGGFNAFLAAQQADGSSSTPRTVPQQGSSWCMLLGAPRAVFGVLVAREVPLAGRVLCCDAAALGPSGSPGPLMRW